MWFIIGIVCAALIFVAYIFLKKTNIKIAWWEWLLVAVAILFFIFAITWMIEARMENEPKAAVTFLWTFGLAGILCVAGACASYFLRNKSAE